MLVDEVVRDLDRRARVALRVLQVHVDLDLAADPALRVDLRDGELGAVRDQLVVDGEEPGQVVAVADRDRPLGELVARARARREPGRDGDDHECCRHGRDERGRTADAVLHVPPPLVGVDGRNLRPDVGRDDRLVGADLVWAPPADHVALVQDDDRLADPHDQPEVVLDHEPTRTPWSPGSARSIPRARPIRVVHPRGRLVEEQVPRPGGERPGDLDPPLVSVGQRLGEAVGERRDPELLEHPLAVGARPAPGDPPGPERAGLDVLERRQPAEQADVLERADDASAGRLVRHARRAPCRRSRSARSSAEAPERQLSSVVLPEPFGPIRPTICPSASDRLTPFSASTPPKRFPTDSASRVTARI